MTKPVILYVGQPILFAHDAWAKFQSSFEILPYDVKSRDELVAAFAEGGRYSRIEGIMRPNMAANMLPPLDEELVALLPSTCRIVAYCNHGYDGQDVGALERRGIWYCNSAGGCTDSTADVGLFLVIAAFRFTSFCELTLRENGNANWFDIQDVVNTAREPGGKVLGIIGMGDVGAAVARRVQAMGMIVHYYNRRRRPDAEAALGAGVVYHDTVEGLLRAADCVLLACPHTPETHHLLDGTTISLMKKGSRVVNIGRGKCIDEEALVEALEDGHIASAGLDVFHDEPVVHPKLLSNKKVTLLPHIAGSTIDADKNFEEITMKNIEAFFLGDGKPLTPVNNPTV
ncbi:hypothetical protein F5X68DRAFT_268456 [Plectosphaerella plurivora]|uniref:Glyoxylate reductase n=1 Tax=Plectosphaerella plurivora TaxID=936078 RepID=A0A9P8VDJ3_9PEZI|nr:hypothetical protein F5X68DRAFT_268456 [Plectosphaerella plurivora]